MYTLHHGDCLDILPTLEPQSIDAIIADIPSGRTACAWDSVIPFDAMWKGIKHVLKPKGACVLLGCTQPFTSALVMSNVKWFKYSLVWDKVMTVEWHSAKHRPMSRHEDIIVFSGGTCANGGRLPMTYNPLLEERSAPRVKVSGAHEPTHKNPKSASRKQVLTVLTHRYPQSIITISNANRTGSLHPTQKPIALLEYLTLTYTNEGDTVLDFTMGSGTTGAACANTGRHFIGIEKDQGYFDIAQQRIASAYHPLQNMEAVA
jgi:site-specific DNA-methyltransferase (adenine-specific)